MCLQYNLFSALKKAAVLPSQLRVGGTFPPSAEGLHPVLPLWVEEITSHRRRRGSALPPHRVGFKLDLRLRLFLHVSVRAVL